MLADAVLDKLIALERFSLNGLVGEALGGGIVDLYWVRRLRVTHFGESSVNGHGLLAVEISGSDFGFGRRSHHIAHDFGHGVKRSIGGGRG